MPSSRSPGNSCQPPHQPVFHPSAGPSATSPDGYATLRGPNDPKPPTERYDPHRMAKDFWAVRKRKMETLTTVELRDSSRCQVLPLARVKKIMKLDDDVKAQMISADAPLLLSVASEMFVEEITLKAWLNTEEGKRKTLQKADVSAAVARNEHFDFLIDIVPREDRLRRVSQHSQQAQQQTATVVDQGNAVQYQMPAGSSSSLATPVSFVLGGENGEMLMRLQNGQVVQATPIGQPIQLPPSAASQLGVAALADSHSPPPSTSSCYSATPLSSAIPARVVYSSAVDISRSALFASADCSPSTSRAGFSTTGRLSYSTVPSSTPTHMTYTVADDHGPSTSTAYSKSKNEPPLPASSSVVYSTARGPPLVSPMSRSAARVRTAVVSGKQMPPPPHRALQKASHPRGHHQ